MNGRKVMRVAVLVACHNRREKTLTCLDALFANHLPEGISIHVILVDDGSTDGTDAAVKLAYRDVNIIRGDGNLFWCGGMRMAFSEALKHQFDGYLFLNDDTKLFPNAIAVLLRTENYAVKMNGSPAIVVGSVVDPHSGQLTYGGRKSRGWRQPLYYDLVPPQPEPVICDTANANCLLIPSLIAEQMGNLDSVFLHGKGDYDYGLRAKRDGFKTYVANAIVGECPVNPPGDVVNFKSLSFLQRWKYLTSPKQFPPVEWMIYTWRHAGIFWFVHWLRPYRRLFY